jgi:hypothetical protein
VRSSQSSTSTWSDGEKTCWRDQSIPSVHSMIRGMQDGGPSGGADLLQAVLRSSVR